MHQGHSGCAQRTGCWLVAAVAVIAMPFCCAMPLSCSVEELADGWCNLRLRAPQGHFDMKRSCANNTGAAGECSLRACTECLQRRLLAGVPLTHQSAAWL